jgi:hypothetical protein
MATLTISDQSISQSDNQTENQLLSKLRVMYVLYVCMYLPGDLQNQNH